jgi:hypothetical protein
VVIVAKAPLRLRKSVTVTCVPAWAGETVPLTRMLAFVFVTEAVVAVDVLMALLRGGRTKLLVAV